MKKKLLFVVLIVLLSVTILTVFNVANGKKKKSDESLYKFQSSFYEEASDFLDADVLEDADIVVRFHTYYEYASSALNCPYHQFSIALPKNGGYSVKADEALSEVEDDFVWSEDNVFSFSPKQGIGFVPAENMFYDFNIYKDGEPVDTVRIFLKDVDKDVNIDGSETKDVIKMISSCESDSLKVVYYNFIMFEDQQ